MKDFSSISAHIDWLTFTHGYPSKGVAAKSGMEARVVAYWCMKCAGIEDPHFQAIKPVPFYSWAFEDIETGYRVYLSGIQKQGMMLQIDGRACEKTKNSITQRVELLNSKDWKCTRCDVAVDMLDHEMVAADFEEIYRAHKHQYDRTTHFIKSVNGDTFYIGSRVSAYYLRVYDKGMQQMTDEDWTRLEIEVKGYSAEQIVKTPLTIIQQGVSAILSVLDGGLPGSVELSLQLIANGQVCPPSTAPNVKTNTELWLETQVLPALQRMWVENPDFVNDWICRVLAEKPEKM